MMVGALVIRKEYGPSAEAIRILRDTVRTSEKQETAAMRATEALSAQGYVAYASTPEVVEYYDKMADAIRQKMTGTLFTPELLRDVEAAVAAAPDVDPVMTDVKLPPPAKRATACEQD